MKDQPEESFVPNLTGINVMVGTPSHDGKYERNFMRALHCTVMEIEKFGGKCDFADFCYCADIALARAKILGMFYRKTEYTHLLFIDADMGWHYADVVRLLLLDRDFIGAAGPKKHYPIQFAANFTDDDLNPLPVMEEVNTGVIRVSEAGLAFMIIKRHVIEKMIAAYPQLEFDGDIDDTEYALFDPIVSNKRRRSEDYAFCKRWVDIGGKIELLTTVELAHTGGHTFKGALKDVFNREGWSVEESTQRENLLHAVEK